MLCGNDGSRALIWIVVPLFLFILSSCASVPDDQERLVAKGKEIFFNETFQGNGRTCGTCHPAENNFTLAGGVGPDSSASSSTVRGD
jgi:cytochrome c peroxidase